ncbi:centrosome-associated protein CEP250-like [Heteronotia binoei]|uniref:centrosome-associated protein CEP250-like n=1 Tax=Heteronotia binoei TaxID=13085 RepID=UPI00292D20E8|nr:centrosome-associated protein CEP250-like [Heteronotia binoei]
MKDLIDERMLQLVDHLTDLKGIPEAETVAKFLLDPNKNIEMLPYAQKLQLINQLIAAEGQQEAEFPIPEEEGQVVEQREKKRHILANIASTLNLLHLTQAEAGQTEEEVNEMAKMRKILLADLESNLKDLQQAETVVPTQEDLENKTNELTKKRSLLISVLESNLINLKEAQAIAATQPSEISKNQVKELLQEREALTACLEANEQELQDTKSQETELVEKIKHEEEINELSGKRRVLLADLEKNLNDLQEAQAIAAIEPSFENDEMIKELAAQRELLTASLEANLEDLEKVQAFVPGPGEESRLKQEEINELSEKRKTLLGNLKSNLKDLQEAQALAAIEPSTMNDEKVKELSEQRKVLAASLDTNLQELQRAQGYVPDPEEESRLKEAELNEQSEKKRLLQERLESNLKNLQQAQILATTQPESMDELKLRELIEERKHLTTELDTAEHVIRGIQRGKELNELSQKKQLLLKNLESNLKDLEEAQAFADAEPGSIAEHKLQELTEQRRHLAADLDATLHHIEELHHQDEAPAHQGPGHHLLAGTEDITDHQYRYREDLRYREYSRYRENYNSRHNFKTFLFVEVELQELSDKKQVLLGKLESTLKELQQAQALASAEPGGASEQKLQVLTEQKRQLTVELESAILDMQEIQLRGEILKSREKEVYQLLEKKQVLLENLVSTLKELQEAHAVAAAEPGSASEEKIQVLREKGRRLTADLEEIAHDIKKAQQHASGRAEQETPGEKELRGLTVKKQHLLQNLTSNLKELEQIQSLASSEPDSSTENQMQQLDEQRKVLSASLDTIIQQIKEVEGRCVPETPKMPVVLKMDLDQLSQHKRLFLESLELNLKDLEEAQALAAAEPGGIAEQKVQELTEERRLLTAGLKAVTEDIADVESQELDKDAIMITREIILDELYQKERLILENLESNWKDLQQAEALAAAEPGGISEEKIKELTEQRRLLASGLETIMQDIQEAEGLDREKLEMLEKIEGGLAELSETTRQLWENLELNLSDLKNLHVLTPSEQDGMPEEQNQMLAEQRKHLTANLSALLQYMEDAQDLVLSGDQIISPDERYLDDVSEIKRLESKLDEILQIGGLSATQLDGMKEKLSKLKEKRGLDRWDTFSQEPQPPTKEELAIYGSDDQVAGKLVGKKRYWSPNLQKRVRDLQQKNIREMQQKNMTLQGDISDLRIHSWVHLENWI